MHGALPDYGVAPWVLQGLGRTLRLGRLQALLAVQVPLEQGEETPPVCAWKSTGHLGEEQSGTIYL